MQKQNDESADDTKLQDVYWKTSDSKEIMSLSLEKK